MRMLWISLLLVGSVSCAPQQRASRGGPPMWMYPASLSVQAWSPQAYKKPVGQASGYVGYSSYPDESSGPVGYGSRPGLYYSSNTNTVGGVSGSPYGVQQAVPWTGQHGAPGGSSSPYQQIESWSSSSDTSGEDEPVFTPVEDKNEVYAFKSRSNYNRKRLLFNQFRYTPAQLYIGEPHHHHHHRHHRGKGHHKYQVKGY